MKKYTFVLEINQFYALKRKQKRDHKKHNFCQLCPNKRFTGSKEYSSLLVVYWQTFNLYSHEPELMSSSLQEHPTEAVGSVDCSVNIIQYVCFLYLYVRLCFSHRNICGPVRDWWVLIWPWLRLLERIVEAREEDVCRGGG